MISYLLLSRQRQVVMYNLGQQTLVKAGRAADQPVCHGGVPHAAGRPWAGSGYFIGPLIGALLAAADQVLLLPQRRGKACRGKSMAPLLRNNRRKTSFSCACCWPLPACCWVLSPWPPAAWLQVYQHEHFATLAQNNNITLSPIIPNRGLIGGSQRRGAGAELLRLRWNSPVQN